MTDLKVTLTDALQKTLGQKGVNAYAVYFDTAGNSPSWTTLVNNGSVQSEGVQTIDLPFPYNGGKIYFLIQSEDPSGPQTDLQTVIAKESEITWQHGETYQYRVDSFEVSLLGKSGDAGNLTSVQGFGLSMELSVSYDNGNATQTRSYAISGDDVFGKIKEINSSAIHTFTGGPLKGDNRAAISPSEAVGLAPPDPTFSTSDWNAYVESLQVANTGIEVAGFFNGAKDGNDIYHNAGFFGYALEWSETDKAFWLNPTDSSHVKGSIKITAEALENSIYSTLGNVEIYTNSTDGIPYDIQGSKLANQSEMNSGANTQWGEVLTQFLTGFTGGYYGTEGASLNSEVADTIDLNKNWNWDPVYAFGNNLSGDGPKFSDPYSEIFFFNSNSYGSGYSDNLMDAYAKGGPLIPVAETLESGTVQNVSQIDLTIYDDSETPSGYTTPVIYNYIAPPGHTDFLTKQADPTSYTPATFGANTAANITLNFFNQNVVLKDDTSITLEIFDGLVKGKEIFRTIEFNVPAGENLWQNWQIVKNQHGVWGANIVPDTAQTTGAMVISSLPTAENGTGWYRITVGDGDAAKTFNLYTKTQNGAFLNPSYTGQEDSLAIDGLALLAPSNVAGTPETLDTFAVNFLYSGSTTLDPSLFDWNTSSSHVSEIATLPAAAVAGTLNADQFTALSNQTQLSTNSVSSNQAQLAFGWTGTNSDPSVGSWISGYTNKISALNLVQVSFFQSGQAVLTPVYAEADIDGRWETVLSKTLGNGTFVVKTTEHIKDGVNVGGQIGAQSDALNVTVILTDYALRTSGSGQGITLDIPESDDGMVLGNWIEFAVSSENTDTSLAVQLYVVDASGNYVGRDGQTGAGVTLSDAIHGTLGVVTDDSGATVAQGAQSIFLEEGQTVRFAQLTGADTIDSTKTVSINPAQDGSYEIVYNNVSITASVQNTLDGAAMLADAQRQLDMPLVYVEQGATVNINADVNTVQTNSIGFVRVDVALDGSVTLNGEAFANTDAFRSKVVKALDGGYRYEFGDAGITPPAWTVAGHSGFYAPVIMTETGNVFVIGDTNNGGAEHIRMFGENMFGFEDLTASENSDFDYNDVVVELLLSGVTGAESLFV
ncbi:hypothetical protein JM93_02755 [Roseibium hamelinense]|uniref:DUF4114 domain-containing protein n=1 Tax=Roseibium hamelinense TaxID=150831 RepID=A0A562SYG7_9HYPH|nr:hypothetical protein [Roseibium hamelinense]MTI44763.1 hypothetical protein [Roseibium hamelinense]TWI86048.1 hypothetical protein JM93_02755 [Roseibium hamelinense]